MEKGSTWSGPKRERMYALWIGGCSAATVARILNNEFGSAHTRNSIIGQMNRHYPDAPSHKIHENKARKRKPRPRPTRVPLSPLQAIMAQKAPMPPRSETDVARVSFADLENGKHCKFIPGNPGDDFRLDKPIYCGMPPVPGTHYCEPHLVRCHSPPELRIRVRVSDKTKEFA
jgi:hypothetical protein